MKHFAGLDVSKEALVTRIIVEKSRARGVEYFASGCRLEIACTDGEVILAAGAIGSPHLLMLSGLGPADHLKEKGVEVVADLPGVGQDLQDHRGGSAKLDRVISGISA